MFLVFAGILASSFCSSASAIDANIYEGECKETRFFKEKLMLQGPWEKEVQAFADAYTLRATISENEARASVLTIELVAKKSKAAIYSDKGFVVLALPSSLHPQQEAGKVSFYVGTREVKGAAFPQFEAILKELLSLAAPGDSVAWAERVFRLVGIGKMDANFNGTLFVNTNKYTMVPVIWETQRVDGKWIEASRVVVTVPLSISARAGRKAISADAFSVMMAVWPNTGTRRVVFAVDKATVDVGTTQYLKRGEGITILRHAESFEFSAGRVLKLKAQTKADLTWKGDGRFRGTFYASGIYAVDELYLINKFIPNEEDKLEEIHTQTTMAALTNYMQQVFRGALPDVPAHVWKEKEISYLHNQVYYVKTKEGGLARIMCIGGENRKGGHIRIRWEYFARATTKGATSVKE